MKTQQGTPTVVPADRREAIARIQTMEAERSWLMDHIVQLNQAREAAIKRLGLLCEQIALERESVTPNVRRDFAGDGAQGKTEIGEKT